MPPKLPCQNPLFLKFLEEARDDAQAKQSKSAHAYNKACVSIRLHPRVEPFPSGLSTCIGVGPGIIKLLTAKLSAYNAANGIVAAVTSPGSSKRSRPGSPSPPPAPKSKAPRLMVHDSDSSDSDEVSFIPPKLAAKQEAKAASAAAKKPRAPPKPKMYVPAEGSGNYAILIAMHKANGGGVENKRMSQGEIVEIAEEGGWSKTSFVKPRTNADRYNAWTGSKTLIQKNLVGMQGAGQKATYWLTDEGAKLAKSLVDHLEGNDDPMDQADPRERAASPSMRAPASSQTVASSSQPTGPRQSAISLLDNAVGRGEQSAGRRVAIDGVGSRNANRPSPTVNKDSHRFGFFFLNRKDERVLLRDGCRIKMLDDGDSLCKIEFRTSQTHHPFVKASVIDTESAPFGRDTGGPTSYGWVFTDDIASKAVPFPTAAIATGPGPSRSLPAPSSSPVASGSGAVNVAQSRLVVPQGMARTLSAQSSMTGPSIGSLVESIAQSRAAAQPVASGSGSGLVAEPRPVSTNAVAGPSKPRLAPAASSASKFATVQAQPAHLSARTQSSLFESEENSHYAHRPLAGPDQESLLPLVPGSSPLKAAAAAAAFDKFAFAPVVWPAGSYEITLVLDTREIGSRKDRQGFFNRLVKEGIQVEQRALHLGDMLWVARRTDAGGAPGEDECVLDWVIERKRLDDLVSSITDGRFKEQKYRMSSSGIPNVIYLIEDHRIEQDLWGPAVATAVSSTQVIDGFFVKRTTNLDASVAYLKAMHETITDLLAHESLHLIPNRRVERGTYLAMQKHLRATQPARAYRTSYEAYGRLNSKSGGTTLGHLWAGMLLTITGLTNEKAAAILEVYPTPKSLWDAYKEADEEEEEEIRRKGGEGGMRQGKGRAKWQRGDRARGLLGERIKAPEGSRRQIGKAVGGKVWEMFRAEEY